MSKSLGNVVLAEHFVQKYGPNTFRYLILNSHYNQVINLSEELIQQAADYTQKIENLLKKLNFPKTNLLLQLCFPGASFVSDR